MTAYELADTRNRIDERIDYFNQCLGKLDDPYGSVSISRNTIEEIKLDYYKYKILINEELKRR